MLKSYFSCTDKGPYFNVNQDLTWVDLSQNLFAVLDGFGGSGIGDLVSQELVAKVGSAFHRIDHDRDATLSYYFDARRSLECNFLANSIIEYHHQLMKENLDKSLYMRGGVCGVFALIKNKRISLLHVGKIYALLLRGGEITELVLADDAAGVPGENGSIVNDSWTKSGVGLLDPLNLHIKDFFYQKDDVLLLATRGAIFGLDKATLAVSMFQKDKEAIKQIFHAANERGNKDNQSSIIIRFS